MNTGDHSGEAPRTEGAPTRPNIPVAVADLIAEYRRFLRTSYRFLDEKLRTQFEEHLAKADVIVRGPYVTLARDFLLGERLTDLIAAGRCHAGLAQVSWAFRGERLFLHQAQALEVGRRGSSFVVTTGTGSGKTEAFLLPVLDGILRRKQEGVKGVQAVLLYPMNALANDQLERLRRMLRGTGADVSFGLYTGESDKTALSLSEQPAETERVNRKAIRDDPPDILLTNYKQLEFLLVRRDDRKLFTPSLRFLVLDELHSYKGALATEIACLIRRVKAHAQVEPGDLVAIGTSATVATGDDARMRLAEFATALFGEAVAPDQVIAESLAPFAEEGGERWTPEAPSLDREDIAALDVQSDEAVVALAERLTGRRAPASGHVADRVAAVLRGNAVVRALEEAFSEPSTVDAAIPAVRKAVPNRASTPDGALRAEIEGYLIVGSVGVEEHRPRLRPKLHTFFHGVYDVWLCLNPTCRALVPRGGERCAKCETIARPAALCRTCGQDFVKVVFERKGDDVPRGSGDYFSDERTAFLTHEIHALGDEDEDVDEGDDEDDKPQRRPRANRLKDVGVCGRCGRVVEGGATCPSCGTSTIPMKIHKGKLNTCPACGGFYATGDIVTPLRTGTASTVSVLATHHLDALRGDDRKLLVFSDNRQDAAHQAGYSADRHRRFALRHVVAHAVTEAGAKGLSFETLVHQVFDRYVVLRIISGKTTGHARERWLDAIRWEVANELTRFSRQRASLLTLGIVAVDYEFLDHVARRPEFRSAASSAGLEVEEAINVVHAVLDVMRVRCGVALDFFQEYVDPNRKARYRELEGEPYCIRFSERDRSPRAFAFDRPAHIRSMRRIEGFVQENAKVAQLAAPQKIVTRLVGNDRRRAEEFLRAVVKLLVEEEVLTKVSRFPMPAKDRVPGLAVLQIDPKVLRIVPGGSGYRCDACRAWRGYRLRTCPNPTCTAGVMHDAEVDHEDYYVRLYLDREPQRLRIREHSAQIGGDDRAKLETDFKEGRLEALVCTPTLELGVDIGPLLTVVLRNAPPSPANYAQRVGRAGRRLRIGFASTFCTSSPHDRHAFQEPEWLVSGQFDPPRLRLDNERIVRRHLHSFLLENIEAELPARMGDLLDDIRTPTAWRADLVQPIPEEVRTRADALAARMSLLFEPDRRANRIQGFGDEHVRSVVDGFGKRLQTVLERWFARVKQLDREYREFAQIGSPRHDQQKAQSRSRAYREITTDPERAYTLNYLAVHDLLPAYQFPLDTFSLDPGVTDTPTLYRPAPIALLEFAPGNFVYANSHKLQSIRVLFAGARAGASGSEAGSGRLASYQFCKACHEPVEAPRNACAVCGQPLDRAEEVAFADAFEAEENRQIGMDEESRQRRNHVRKEHLLLHEDAPAILYGYELSPLELLPEADLLITNWGPRDPGTSEGRRFLLCADCGRHLPYDLNDVKQKKQVEQWLSFHKKFCMGDVRSFVLGYRYRTNALVLTVPSAGDRVQRGGVEASPSAVTLAESLLMACADLLEIEENEVTSFVRTRKGDVEAEQIVFYETVPGGAGYLEHLAKRLPEAARRAQELLFGHDCAKACYVCLKRYGNQFWHAFMDKDAVRDVLVAIASLDRVEPTETKVGAGRRALGEMLDLRQKEVASAHAGTGDGRYRHGEIEERLLAAMEGLSTFRKGVRDYEIHDPTSGRLVTVPDFTWPQEKVAVFCDGYAYHGTIDALVLDAEKRNWLQTQGWLVLTFWGRTLMRDVSAARAAAQIQSVLKSRAGA